MVVEDKNSILYSFRPSKFVRRKKTISFFGQESRLMHIVCGDDTGAKWGESFVQIQLIACEEIEAIVPSSSTFVRGGHP